MRIINFLRLINKKTDGAFGAISILFILFVLNLIIIHYGYGLVDAREDKPYWMWIVVSSTIHGLLTFGGFIVYLVLKNTLFPFITDTIIPTWQEADNNPQTDKSGGKVKFK